MRRIRLVIAIATLGALTAALGGSSPAAARDGVTFVNVNSGLCLDNPGGGGADARQLEQWACNGSNNQRWRLTFAGYGNAYTMTNVAGNVCADIYADQITWGNKIDRWYCNGTLAQVFYLAFNLISGDYLITPVQQQYHFAVEVYGGSRSNGAKIDLWGTNGNSNQYWYQRP